MAITHRKDPNSYFRRIPFLKKLFWLYFFLLIFEGALRKWVIPQISAPLLVVRDPISFWIIWEAYRTHKWPARWSAVIAILSVAFVGLFVVQLVAVGNPWFVGVYGLRSYLLPFPVLFIMGENLNREDLHRFGAWTLWLLLPITGLEVAQYLSPAGSFLNKATIEGGRQIYYVIGHIRAAGPFSYSVGAVDYGVLAGCFLCYGLVSAGLVQKWLLWASAFALVIAVPILGARAFVFQLAAILGCVAIGAMFGLAQFARTIKVLFPILVIVAMASFLPIFSDAMSNLTLRFTQANADEGSSTHSITSRMISPIVDAVTQADFSDDWMGHGMGLGSTAMTVLLTGRPQFLAGEGQTSRDVMELGPFFGVGFLLFRVVLSIVLLLRALSLTSQQEPLALLMAPLSLSSLIWCVMEQPTEQGFMVMSMAFTLAALKRLEPSPVQLPAPVRYVQPVRVRRLELN